MSDPEGQETPEAEAKKEEPVDLDKDNQVAFIKNQLLINCFALASGVRLPSPQEMMGGRKRLVMDFVVIQGNLLIGSVSAPANQRISINQKFHARILLTPISEDDYLKRQGINLIEVKGTEGLGLV